MALGRYQMQHWGPAAERRWTPMEEGPGPWKPVATSDAAIAHCIAWTGGIGIPAMQVVDLSDGSVVWRDSRRYPEAGPSIALALRGDFAAAPHQLALFDA